MTLSIQDLGLPKELTRLQFKELAEESRFKFSKKGIVDIFEILEDVSFLIRIPMGNDMVSGFTTYYEEEFVVFVNSSKSLGHERYSAAHELYHILYNGEILRRESIFPEKVEYQNEENNANYFAAEFLMPEEYVRKLFKKMVDLSPSQIEARHIVRLNSTLKVSYKAMLKRLIQLNLCDITLYNSLASYSSIQQHEKLVSITKKEGYASELLLPSETRYISKEYLEIIKNNYENQKISYKKIAQLLSFIQETPEKYGYEVPTDDDIV